MDENNKWMMLLLFLFHQTERQWREFETEIKYNNRYFPKSQILDELKRIQKYAVHEIHADEVYYRARVFSTPWECFKEELEQIRQIILKHFPDIENGKSSFNLDNMSDMQACLAMLLCMKNDSQSIMEEIELIFEKEKKFWGYDAEQSDAPPKDKTLGGRANPKNISYLYIAEDLKTTMMEVRPNLTQEVSVATIKILKTLRLFDFCYVDPEEEAGKSLDLSIISTAFSTPNFGNENDYYATQYLCEFIKELGFDGIRFYSSLNPPGKNIVLFNTKRNPTTKSKDYEIVESKVYSITKLDLNYQIIAPIEK